MPTVAQQRNWLLRAAIVGFWGIGLATTDAFAAGMALLLGQVRAILIVTVFGCVTGGAMFALLGTERIIGAAQTWLRDREERLMRRRTVQWALKSGRTSAVLVAAAAGGPMSGALALRLLGPTGGRAYPMLILNALAFALAWAGVIWGIPAAVVRHFTGIGFD